jgi:hypothetical protein
MTAEQLIGENEIVLLQCERHATNLHQVVSLVVPCHSCTLYYEPRTQRVQKKPCNVEVLLQCLDDMETMSVSIVNQQNVEQERLLAAGGTI